MAKKTQTAETKSESNPQPEPAETPSGSRWARIATIFKRRPRMQHSPNPHHAFKLTPVQSQKAAVRDVRAGWRLLGDTWRFTRANYRLLGGLAVIYAITSAILVGGISQIDYAELKDSVAEAAGGKLTSVTGAVSMFGAAIGTLNRPASDLQQFLSGMLTMLFWLSVVWASRMLMAGKTIALRDALYNSASPIVGTFLLLLVLTLQLLPAIIGIFAYAIAISGQWLGGGVEGLIFGVAALLLTLLSLHWVVGTLVAAIIVTLPGMYPVRALREAKVLVANRRGRIAVRMMVMGVVVCLIWLLILMPAILFDGWLDVAWLPLVPLVVQALMGVTLVFVSTYMYRLYRSLL